MSILYLRNTVFSPLPHEVWVSTFHIQCEHHDIECIYTNIFKKQKNKPIWKYTIKNYSIFQPWTPSLYNKKKDLIYFYFFKISWWICTFFSLLILLTPCLKHKWHEINYTHLKAIFLYKSIPVKHHHKKDIEHYPQPFPCTLLYSLLPYYPYTSPLLRQLLICILSL